MAQRKSHWRIPRVPFVNTTSPNVDSQLATLTLDRSRVKEKGIEKRCSERSLIEKRLIRFSGNIKSFVSLLSSHRYLVKYRYRNINEYVKTRIIKNLSAYLRTLCINDCSKICDFVLLTNDLTFAGNTRAFLVIIKLANTVSVRARVQQSGTKWFNDKLGRYRGKLRRC